MHTKHLVLCLLVVSLLYEEVLSLNGSSAQRVTVTPAQRVVLDGRDTKVLTGKCVKVAMTYAGPLAIGQYAFPGIQWSKERCPARSRRETSQCGESVLIGSTKQWIGTHLGPQ